MNLPLITTTFRSEGGAASYSLVVRSSTEEREAVQAADGSVLILGVTTIVAASDGQPMDVVRAGFADVRYGATVTADDPLTADANGDAVPASAGDHIIGYADMSGDVGDIGAVWINPGILA